MNWTTLMAGCAALALAGCAVSRPEAVSPPAAARPAADLSGMTAAALAQEIRQGRITAVEATQYYLDRIAAHDRSGAQLQSVIALDPTALEQAARLDALAAQGRFAGALHGIPVLVKDTIDVEGVATTAGSLALTGNVAAEDARIVARLRAEGAVILGKTNLSEWSNFRAGGMPAGWSAVGGQTQNPFSADHSPCGSSSGSAVAVAAGFAPLSLGAETSASLICPGAVNGIVAFKPTVGFLPQDGMVLVSSSQDTAGPMAQSVADIALAMDAMTGDDPEDGFVAALNADLTGLRIGVFRWAEGGHPGVSAAFDSAVGLLETAGATLVEIDHFEPDPAMWQHGEIILMSELAANLDTYLAGTPETVEVRSLADLLAFNASEPREETARFGQTILERAAEAPGVDTTEHRDRVAAVRTAAREHGIDRLLEEHGVDVLVMPAAPPAAPLQRDPETQALRRNVGATWLPAMAGYPMITVPMGATDGLPLGLGILAGGGDDSVVIRVGYALEQLGPEPLRPVLEE
ncbi:amidase family protein [Maricaulis virginensis]|uniref:Amidase n=1 Tax=Maricaulis virginensis TaxID=144022 RepID=A0A9W6INV0_9PROT|nr:amidase family protein [Maricaulis virginensis]GLK52927.1 amidase [Maricaulis virginensis]